MLLTVLLLVGGLVFRGYQAGQPHPATVAGDDFSMNAAILSNVNYGTLTVNGKQLHAHPPVIVTLHPGTNTITISAPPSGHRPAPMICLNGVSQVDNVSEADL